jgi:hypothetical protein
MVLDAERPTLLIPKHTTEQDPKEVHNFITMHLRSVSILLFLPCVGFCVDFFHLHFTVPVSFIFIYFFKFYFMYCKLSLFMVLQSWKCPVNSGTAVHRVEAAVSGLAFSLAIAPRTDDVCLILFPLF